MSNSLQDQLLKSGLIDKNKVNKAKSASYKQQKQQKRGKKKGQQVAVESESRQLANQALADKAARDRALNQQATEAAEQRAVRAQIAQLIRQHALSTDGGEIAYHFSANGKVERLFVTAEQQTQLAKGRLAVVYHNKVYALVPAAVAEKIRLRDEASVIVCNDAGQDGEGDDPYADYPVPDDLQW